MPKVFICAAPIILASVALSDNVVPNVDNQCQDDHGSQCTSGLSMIQTRQMRTRQMRDESTNANYGYYKHENENAKCDFGECVVYTISYSGNWGLFGTFQYTGPRGITFDNFDTCVDPSSAAGTVAESAANFCKTYYDLRVRVMRRTDHGSNEIIGTGNCCNTPNPVEKREEACAYHEEAAYGPGKEPEDPYPDGSHYGRHYKKGKKLGNQMAERSDKSSLLATVALARLSRNASHVAEDLRSSETLSKSTMDSVVTPFLAAVESDAKAVRVQPHQQENETKTAPTSAPSEEAASTSAPSEEAASTSAPSEETIPAQPATTEEQGSEAIASTSAPSEEAASTSAPSEETIPAQPSTTEEQGSEAIASTSAPSEEAATREEAKSACVRAVGSIFITLAVAASLL